MSARSSDADEILAKISSPSRRLPHPVDLLTAEQISDVANVPKSTILSAAGGMSEVRSQAFANAIGRLVTTPGAAVWEALRSAINHRESVVDAVAALMQARADELSADPALGFLLSGYEFLDDKHVRVALGQACHDVVDGFAPFVDTVLQTVGEHRKPLSEASRSLLLGTMLGLALDRLLGGQSSLDSAQDVLKTRIVCQVFDEGVGAPSDETSVRVLPPREAAPLSGEGSLGHAVNAAAGLLLNDEVPVRFGMKLEEVLEQTGLSSAGFYRRFESMAGFEDALLETSGRVIVDGVRDEFYDEVLQVFGADSPGHDPAQYYRDRVLVESIGYVESSRPGMEAVPWLTSWVGSAILVPAYQEAFRVRSDFYAQMCSYTGVRLVSGIDADDFCRLMYSLNVVAELVARSASDSSSVVIRHLLDRGWPVFASFFEPA